MGDHFDREGLAAWGGIWFYLCFIGALSSLSFARAHKTLMIGLAVIALPVPYVMLSPDNRLYRAILSFASAFYFVRAVEVSQKSVRRCWWNILAGEGAEKGGKKRIFVFHVSLSSHTIFPIR